MNFVDFLISYFKQRYRTSLLQGDFSALNNRQKCLLRLKAIRSGNLELVAIQAAILLEPLKDQTSIAEQILYNDY